MKFLFLHAVVKKYDAVGNDIELMYRILSDQGYDCFVYAEQYNIDNIRYVTYDEAVDMISDSNNVIIYHHSLYWKNGLRLLRNIGGRLVIRYHNVTPPAFFSRFQEGMFWACKKGVKQTLELQRRYPRAYWLSASKYDDNDVLMIPENQRGVLAPLNKTEEWGMVKADESVIQKLEKDKCFKLLFVGRMAPNKGHLMMLDILKAYKEYYDKDIELYIIGSMGMIPNYDQMIRNRILEYDLENNIEFVGEIDDSKLVAYYKGCDVMLLCSEHEGFCVPIIEANYFKMPVVALGEAAVVDTMGEHQLVIYRNEGVEAFVVALKILNSNSQYRRQLGENGYINYMNCYSRDCLEKKFVDEINKIISIS